MNREEKNQKRQSSGLPFVRPELLSPAGDAEGARAALKAGADAVYLGGTLFSARAYARNLSEDEILSVIDLAHLFDRKVYLTCNILLRDKELPEAAEMIAPLYERGLDGIIVQDLGLMSVLREVFPGLPLHASTQMAVLSAQGAEWLKTYGVSRVVPGRELSLPEIRNIADSGIEVECFVHGAMCYSYSGRCLFSSIAGGRSGNRGRCAGPCRQRYLDENGEAGYFLSMKDMCALERIGELIDAGVASFKIEGRMKASEYTAGVTAVYRKYIDRYLAEGRIRPEPEDRKTLESLYIRSKRQEGYLHRHNGREMISVDSPAYTETPEALRQRIRERFVESPMKREISLYCLVRVGEPLYLRAISGGAVSEIRAKTVEEARSRSMGRVEIEKQLRKTGDTSFAVGELTVETDDRSFVPVGELNALRRDALETLKEMLLKDRRRTIDAEGGSYRKAAPFLSSDPVSERPGTGEPDPADGERSVSVGEAAEKKVRRIVGVNTKEQAVLVMGHPFAEGIIVPLHLFSENAPEFANMAGRNGKKLYLRLPQILRQKDVPAVGEMLRQAASAKECGMIGGIYCGSIDALSLAGEVFPGKARIAEESLYAWNRQAVELILKHAYGYTMSAELNGKELMHAIRREAAELIVYGYQPLMYSANCLQKTLTRCDASGGIRRIRDEKGHVFYSYPVHRYCYNVLYNCVPLSLHRQLPEIIEKKTAGTIRLEFTMEDVGEVGKILDRFSAILDNEAPEDIAEGSYTGGHYKRGAI